MSCPTLCSCSPYTLIVGKLWHNPVNVEELFEIARRVYDSGTCWTVDKFEAVLGLLRSLGLVKMIDGKLVLELKHPDDLEYAKKASEFLRALG